MSWAAYRQIYQPQKAWEAEQLYPSTGRGQCSIVGDKKWKIHGEKSYFSLVYILKAKQRAICSIIQAFIPNLSGNCWI
jgi:hypothetical protein